MNYQRSDEKNRISLDTFYVESSLKNQEWSILQELHEAYGEDCRRLLLRKGGLSESDVEDILHNTLLRIQIKADQYRAEIETIDKHSGEKRTKLSNPKSWYFRLAMNEAAAFLRERSKFKVAENLDQFADETGREVDEYVSVELARIQAAVATLDPEKRYFLRQIYSSRDSKADVGRRLGMKPSATRTAHHRIISLVRELLEEDTKSSVDSTVGHSPCEPVSVMVLDDDLRELKMIGRLVTAAGGILSAFQTVERALMALRQGLRFDLTIVDMMLGPDWGDDFARQVDAEGLSSGHLVLITAKSHLQQRCVTAGFEFIPKPLEASQVKNLIVNAA